MEKRNSSVKISRILHAGYLLEYEGITIAFDPLFENPFSINCYAFPDVQFDKDEISKLHLDAVFISHYHDDHCSLESLNLLNRHTPIYIFCLYEELLDMIRELGFTKVYSLKLNINISVGPFEVTPLRALDADVDSIFHIRVATFNILNVVDSWIDDEVMKHLQENKPWDLILWPFQTMREIEVLSPYRATPAPQKLPQEWLDQIKVLNPRYLIPSSCQFTQENWSWYRKAFFPISYRGFQEQINAILPQTKVVKLDPSNSIALENNLLQRASPLSWIHPIGDPNIDYEYDASFKPPSTAEIATHFESLSEQQIKRVYDFCYSEILEKYKTLEDSEEEYFLKPRLWCLTLYNNIGAASYFYYHIDGRKMEVLSDGHSLLPLSWTTEVPIAKLYGALECGETLTSMYVRINSETFAPEIEKELSTIDLMEDPLIRCLFSGLFGAYQKAQLKRLKQLKI